MKNARDQAPGRNNQGPLFIAQLTDSRSPSNPFLTWWIHKSNPPSVQSVSVGSVKGLAGGGQVLDSLICGQLM